MLRSIDRSVPSAFHTVVLPPSPGVVDEVGRSKRSKNPTLLAKLYMPALTARIHNPTVRAFCERLKQHGKPHMVIVVAAMRKLLHIVWGVLRNQQSFKPVAP